jgi:hypothetical protein
MHYQSIRGVGHAGLEAGDDLVDLVLVVNVLNTEAHFHQLRRVGGASIASAANYYAN